MKEKISRVDQHSICLPALIKTNDRKDLIK